MRFQGRCLLAAGMAFLCTVSSEAQQYPSRAVTVVVSFAAGSSTDALARPFVRVPDATVVTAF